MQFLVRAASLLMPFLCSDLKLKSLGHENTIFIVLVHSSSSGMDFLRGRIVLGFF